jgi:hypothetical protein
MKQLLTTILILNFGFSFGQAFSYPTIDIYGQKLSDFIPNGWTLLDSAKSDMNNDGNNDLAFVLQYRDSVSIVKTEYGDTDTVITQPRMLLLAFYNINEKRYEIKAQSNTFILNHDNPDMGEPFQDISISKGILKIDFDIFMNSGGWGTFRNTYKFRYQDKEFKLIGVDYYYLNRGSGETEDRSYNFLTKKVRISTGTISSDFQKTKWRKFQLIKLKTLKTFNQPFTWEIEKDFYL